MKVVDASAIYHILLNTPRAAAVVAHLDDDLFAPDLLMTEILQRLRRHVLGAVVDPDRADRAVATLLAADIEYLPTWPYASRIWELRHNITAYDACYVAVAEDLGCPLVTADARLGGAPGLRASVIVV